MELGYSGIVDHRDLAKKIKLADQQADAKFKRKLESRSLLKDRLGEFSPELPLAQ